MKICSMWSELAKGYPLSSQNTQRGRELFGDYERKGDLDLSLDEIKDLPIGVVIDFFGRLARMRSKISPVARRQSGRWLKEVDVCFFYPLLAGDMIRAAFTLTTIPSKAILLPPLTITEQRDLRAVVSHVEWDRRLLHPGIQGDRQLALFVEAAHFLKKCVGLTLDYRVSPSAHVVLKTAGLFRWSSKGGKLDDETLADRIETTIKRYREEHPKISSEMIAKALQLSGCQPLAMNFPRSVDPTWGGGEAPPQAVLLFALKSRNGRTTAEQKMRSLAYFEGIARRWASLAPYDFLFLRGLDNLCEEDAPLSKETFTLAVRKIKEKVGPSLGILAVSRNERATLGEIGVDQILLPTHSRPLGKGVVEKILGSSPEELFFLADGAPLLCHFFFRFLGGKERKRYEPFGFSLGKWNLAGLLSGASGEVKSPCDRRRQKVHAQIEHLWLRFRTALRRGRLMEIHETEEVSWWIRRHRTTMLIPVLYWGEGDESEINIDYGRYLPQSAKGILVTSFDFSDECGDLCFSPIGSLFLDPTAPWKFRLYVIIYRH